MNLKTQIITIIVSVTVICIVALTTYSTNAIQHESAILSKESLQDFVSSIKIIFRGKYYSDQDEKLDLIETMKRELTNEEILLKEASKNVVNSPEEQSIDLIMGSFVKLGQRLIIYSHWNNKFLAKKNPSHLLKLRNEGNIPLSELMKNNRMTKGKFYVLNDNDRKLLVYIFLSKINNAPANIAIIKDITADLTKQDDSEMEYASSVQELFGYADMRSEDNFEVLITSSKGKILTSNNNKLVGQPFNINEYFTDEELNKPLASCKEIDNMFICSTRFKHANVNIIAKITLNGIGYYTKSLITNMITMAAIILFIGISFSLVAVRKITHSLSRIKERAQNIANANLSDPKILPDLLSKEPPSNNEIGKLNNAIDLMVTSLGANTTKLLQANTKQNRYDTELNVAHNMQIGMLPNSDTIPKSEKFGFFTFMNPAKEVGGDLYDIFRIDDEHIALIIGDVSDKGVPAALFMSICSSTLRLLIKKSKSISQSLYELNNVMSERNPSMMFVTVFVGILNEKTGELKYGNAGHCLPYIVNGKQITKLDNLSGPAIGAFENNQYEEFTTTLNNNEYLFCYSDGISEAQNTNQEFFGEERIQETLEQGNFIDERSLIYEILDKVLDFREKADQSDDMTMLCIFTKQK